MAIKTYVTVIPDNKGWIVKTGLKSKGYIVSKHRKKQPAINSAKKYAKKQDNRPSLLKIRNKSGVWSKTHTYK